MKGPTWLEVLAGAPSTVVEASKSEFKITVLKRPEGHAQFEKVDSWGVAFGQLLYQTPSGYFALNSKVKYPKWQVPDSQWAIDVGLVPGTIYRGGTDENPLKERWLGVTDPADGIGIHGTADKHSIGTYASHGCIRMKPHAVIELYDLVPRGTVLRILD